MVIILTGVKQTYSREMTAIYVTMVMKLCVVKAVINTVIQQKQVIYL